jgi:hypothetical protein
MKVDRRRDIVLRNAQTAIQNGQTFIFARGVTQEKIIHSNFLLPGRNLGHNRDVVIW